jgi:hypothetical protein
MAEQLPKMEAVSGSVELIHELTLIAEEQKLMQSWLEPARP